MKKNAALVIDLLNMEKVMTVSTSDDDFKSERKITFTLEDENGLVGEALVSGTSARRGRTRVPVDFEDPEDGMESLEDMLCVISAFISPLADARFTVYKTFNGSPLERFDLVHVPNLSPVIKSVPL